MLYVELECFVEPPFVTKNYCLVPKTAAELICPRRFEVRQQCGFSTIVILEENVALDEVEWRREDNSRFAYAVQVRLGSRCVAKSSCSARKPVQTASPIRPELEPS